MKRGAIILFFLFLCSVSLAQRASIGIKCMSLEDAKSTLRSSDNTGLAELLPRSKIGVYVVEINAEGGMARAGVQAGDIITKIDKTSIKSPADINEWATKAELGKTYLITLLRLDDGQKWQQKGVKLKATESKGDLPPKNSRTEALTKLENWESEQLKLSPDKRPFEIKGDRLGMTLEMFKGKHYRTASDDPRTLPFSSDDQPTSDNPSLLYKAEYAKAGIVHARTNFPFEERRSDNPVFATIAGAKANPFIYAFVDGQLYQMTIFFAHDDFDQVMEAMRAKYGNPSQKQERTYQNAFGANFVGDVVCWSNSVSDIAVFERAGNTDDSLMIVAHKALFNFAQNRLKVANPPRKDDL